MNEQEVTASMAVQFETLCIQELIVQFPDLLTVYLHYLRVSDYPRYLQALAYLQIETAEAATSRS